MKEIKWRNLPLKNTIIEILFKNKGMMTDTDLYNRLAKENKSLSNSDLSKCIMALEIEGLINVTKITKTKNKVELINTDLLAMIKK
ncbi:MAG: transcriptional repressor [Candidatus Helarchaeota archaeon]|nr:transcriptional repressor [Candidatus Helarchaeota archaeon]